MQIFYNIGQNIIDRRPLLRLGAGFEPFVHEEVEPVVDVEPQVVQLVG